MTKPTFDMEAALQALRDGKSLNGKDGILTPLIKQLTEAAMQGELDQHLAEEESPNRKNGTSKKTIKTTSGSFELNAPRDRAGSFEPQIVKKNQTHLTDDLERKIIALFALGNSYQDIRMHIEDMYGIELSNGTLNAVTDKLIPELQAWRERDLDAIYPIVWLDAIHYKIKENGRFISKAVYTILGLTVEGKKELLGLYLSDAEGAHFKILIHSSIHSLHQVKYPSFVKNSFLEPKVFPILYGGSAKTRFTESFLICFKVFKESAKMIAASLLQYRLLISVLKIFNFPLIILNYLSHVKGFNKLI